MPAVFLVIGILLGVAGTWFTRPLSCSKNTFERSVGTLIVFEDGRSRIAEAHKIGPHCWITGHWSDDKTLLSGNGTAHSGPWKHEWTLYSDKPKDAAADAAWFAANCVEPPTTKI